MMLRASYGEELAIFVNVGIYASYVSKQYTEMDYSIDRPTETINTNYFTEEDFGLAGGFGASYPIGSRFLVNAEVRGNYGLKDISAIPIINGGSIKNRSMGMLLSVLYRLGASDS